MLVEVLLPVQALESVRHELECGHLGRALLVYLKHDVPIPASLRRAIIDKSEERQNWNDVLGRLHPKNEKRQRREHRDLIDRVWNTAQELRADEKHQVDDGLFEAIGERLEVNPSIAKRIYYSIPGEVRTICERLGVTISLFQTFRTAGCAPKPRR
jgi:hypothetical protein